MEKTVRPGFVTAWRFATVPTRRSLPWVNATTDGVVRPPSALGMTVGSPPSRTAMHEFVVPRSIPIVFAMWVPTTPEARGGAKKSEPQCRRSLASFNRGRDVGGAYRRARFFAAFLRTSVTVFLRTVDLPPVGVKPVRMVTFSRLAFLRAARP